MKEHTEINRGYIDYIRNLNHTETGSAASAAPIHYPLKEWLRLRFNAYVANVWWPSVGFCGLLATALFLQVWLRVYLFFKRSKPSQLTRLAAASVDEFLEQYPFHLYPILCKTFVLACLENELPNLLDGNSRTVEIAIGDGTLSSRVFPAEAKVVGLDLSPYSLKKASVKPHVKQAIVCDCLNPPIREGSFDVLISNNFLHHVTNKEQTLSGWSRIAEKTVFNENSPTWASGWPVPYVLKRLGRREAAARAASRIERDSLQSLESKESLDGHVTKNYEILQCVSYISERTFFYCGIFSFMMSCYGPPTPPVMKEWFLSARMRRIVLPLTASLARLLIRYDQHQDRSTDSFITYICRSRNYVPARPGNYLACPNCHGELTPTNQCTQCKTEYSYTDGMLFLLPRDLADLQQEYNQEVSSQIPKEHL